MAISFHHSKASIKMQNYAVLDISAYRFYQHCQVFCNYHLIKHNVCVFPADFRHLILYLPGLKYYTSFTMKTALYHLADFLLFKSVPVRPYACAVSMSRCTYSLFLLHITINLLTVC